MPSGAGCQSCCDDGACEKARETSHCCISAKIGLDVSTYGLDVSSSDKAFFAGGALDFLVPKDFALEGLHMKLAGADREDVLLRLLFKLRDTFDVSKLAA